MEKLKSQLKFDFMFTVPSSGRSGGLCAMWKSDANLSLRSYSSNHIDFEVGGVGDDYHWRCTFFYGYPAEVDIHKSWSLLQRLRDNSNLPWCCMGDFNEVLRAEEQEGGDLRSERQMEGFRHALSSCQLNDLGFVGHKFTWVTTRCGGIKVRLDRVLATQSWVDLFPSYKVTHLKPTSSDHIPILLEWNPKKRVRFKKTFRYEDGWAVQDGCGEAVKLGWESEFQGSPMFRVTEKITATRI